MTKLLSTIVAVALFAGCHHSDDPPAFAGDDGFPGDNQLAERASFDLACPHEQLRVHEIGFRQYGITGCGKRATYIPSRGGWFMNSQVSAGPSDAPPPPPPPPPVNRPAPPTQL